LTELLLAKNGVTDIKWDYGFSHPGEDNKKQVERLLTQTWDLALYQGQLLEWQQHHMQADLDLYADVVAGVDLQGQTWGDVSWLRNK
jgi:hypothetical protein